MLIVTTSWDDGDILDLSLSKLLDEYGIKGTFYISKSYRPERLSDSDIRELGGRHEIGSHTLTHLDLEKASDDAARKELVESKRWLEEILRKEVNMFCYPFGRLGENSAALVKEAGYKGARTTDLASFETGPDAFHMPTTIQAYPLPFRRKSAHSLYWRRLFQPLRRRGPALHELGISWLSLRSWESAAKAAFKRALEESEKYPEKKVVFHLWGHSWEIEKYHYWQSLERVLGYIGKREDCRYVTNGEVL